MRAELITFETEDFGKTGFHKADRVLRLGTDPDTGEPIHMRLTKQEPQMFYLNETIYWIAGAVMWVMSVEEYNEITRATDELIGRGRAGAHIVAENGQAPDIESAPDAPTD